MSIGSQVFDSVAAESLLPNSALLAQLPIILVGGLALALVMATFRLFEE